MMRIGYSRRLFILLLCVFFIFMLTSCESATTHKIVSVAPSTATTTACANPTQTIVHPSASPLVLPSVSSSAVPSYQFVNRLTSTGAGLVREVPPSSFRMAELSSLGGCSDIRYLDCPKYLQKEQLQQLVDSIPNITFSTKTVWPLKLPSNYHYSSIMESGKNPGLGVKDLHRKGITGKGVSIAIIDQTLFTGHTEYKNNLALYEEIHVLPCEPAAMHGSAVSSIAVGKTCGVAPDAKLYYWAVNLAKDPNSQDFNDAYIAFAEVADAIDRMLEINAKLPDNEKIRVLSISRGFNNLQDVGVQKFLQAVERANKARVFVLTTSNYQYCDFMSYATDFAGLGKVDLVGNPDALFTYTLGYFEQKSPDFCLDRLLVPMDARTVADPCGAEDYAFFDYGGFSWIAPYLAGLYALAVQVKPDIMPDVFWETALDTSSQLTVTLNNKQYTFNHVVNPAGLITALK